MKEEEEENHQVMFVEDGRLGLHPRALQTWRLPGAHGSAETSEKGELAGRQKRRREERETAKERGTDDGGGETHGRG